MQLQAMTAKQVAEYLGLAISTVYTLPIPHYAYGSARRYDIQDVENYKQSCRLLKTNQAAIGLSLTASSPTGASELANYFRAAGHPVKPTTTTKKKLRGYTHLQVVKTNRPQ